MMKEELEIKYVLPYFYESRPSPPVQAHRSKIIISSPRHDIKNHQKNQKQVSPVKCNKW